MLSAVVLADADVLRLSEPDRVRAIVKTLAAFVPLVVADLIADAAIVALPDAGIAGLEDVAGCKTFADANLGVALARAMNAARRDHIFLMRPGYAPDSAFMGEIEQLMEQGAPKPVALLAAPETFAQRLFAGMAPTIGLVARRTTLAAPARRGTVDISTLRKALSAGPMRSRASRL